MFNNGGEEEEPHFVAFANFCVVSTLTNADIKLPTNMVSEHN